MKTTVIGLFAVLCWAVSHNANVYAFPDNFPHSGAYPVVAGTVYTPIPQGVVYEPQYKIVREPVQDVPVGEGEFVTPKVRKTADLVPTNELHFYNVPKHQVYRIYGRSGRNIRIKR